MKPLQSLTAIAAVALALVASPSTSSAQENQGNRPPGGRGNFNPEDFRKRALERMREQFEVKDDAEWKIISERVEKVFNAQRDARPSFGFGFGRGPGGDRGGDRGGDSNRPNPFRGEPNPDQEALQKALEAKAPAAEIKDKLAKFRDSRKTREEKLAKAQDDLKQVLSARQEATAVLMGLLK
jgi:Spy/CpxP family protein refolding chaperone